MKEVRFSRHARRRMKLYNISENIVIEFISESISTIGRHVLVRKVAEHALPIKIVVEAKVNEIVVITAYPLKRGLK